MSGKKVFIKKRVWEHHKVFAEFSNITTDGRALIDWIIMIAIHSEMNPHHHRYSIKFYAILLSFTKHFVFLLPIH